MIKRFIKWLISLFTRPVSRIIDEDPQPVLKPTNTHMNNIVPTPVGKRLGKRGNNRKETRGRSIRKQRIAFYDRTTHSLITEKIIHHEL